MANSGSDLEDSTVAPRRDLELTVNGVTRRVTASDGALFVDVVREQCGMTGTHVGCYNGDCGACTMQVNGQIVKSCIVLAASVDGANVKTIEGIAAPDGSLDELQQALWDNDSFQCGFCLPGHLFALRDMLAVESDPTEQDVRDALVGNLCRCTGYVNLVRGALDAAGRISAASREADLQPDETVPTCKPWSLHH